MPSRGIRPSAAQPATQLDSWLAQRGLKGNPFEKSTADHDQELPNYFVDIGGFDELLRQTQPCIVFAERGCGKTAQRQMLAALLADGDQLRCVASASQGPAQRITGFSDATVRVVDITNLSSVEEIVGKVEAILSVSVRQESAPETLRDEPLVVPVLVREAGLLALEVVEGAAAVPRIRALVNDPDPIVSRHAAAALARLDGTQPAEIPMYSTVEKILFLKSAHVFARMVPEQKDIYYMLGADLTSAAGFVPLSRLYRACKWGRRNKALFAGLAAVGLALSFYLTKRAYLKEVCSPAEYGLAFEKISFPTSSRAIWHMLSSRSRRSGCALSSRIIWRLFALRMMRSMSASYGSRSPINRPVG